jgi:hypothetical protein
MSSPCAADAASCGDAGRVDAGNSDAGEPDAGPIVLHPSNILNNGGFELGTMCYGQYEWATDPSNVGTGYQFSLSTDAHSGSYAAQIQCVDASQCGYPAKAALQASPSFHTPYNQPYNVSVYTRCSPGDLAFFYTPNAAVGTNIPDFICDGGWAENTFSFTSTPTDDYIYYALYYAGTSSLWIDDLVITYGDGGVPVQTIRHAGQRNVGVSNDTFTVDGKPFLPLGFYQIPSEALRQAQALGVNAVAWGDPGCYNTDAPVFADVAYEAGISLVPESSSTARAGVAQVFSAVMHPFGTHLADIAWYLDDEPDVTQLVWEPVSPLVLTSEYEQIKSASPLPVAVMLQHAHYDPASVDQPYAPAMDIYLSEPYGADFSGVTHSISVFDTMTTRPVWFAMDDGPGDAGIVAKAYFGFTSGGSGLFFFTWDQLVADGTLSAAGQAITELSSLTEVITGADVTSQMTGPPGISFIGRTSGGHTYIIAVNPAATAVTGAFTAPGVDAGQSITVQFEGRTVSATAGGFSDTFPPTSRHVYELN